MQQNKIRWYTNAKIFSNTLNQTSKLIDQWTLFDRTSNVVFIFKFSDLLFVHLIPV